MPPDNTTTPANGTTPAKSFREIAEDAYDEVLDSQDAEERSPSAEPARQSDRTRDNLGRFARAEPGEAAEEAPPSPETTPQSPVEPHPAPDEGSSSEAPVNWSANDRAMFANQSEEARAFLLRRHSEMEGDYQRRVQGSAQAAQFTQALSPIFNDPVIAGSLAQARMTAYDAIADWAGMHRRAMSPQVQERTNLWLEIGDRLGLNPAALFQNRPGFPAANGNGLPPDLPDDPGLRFIADKLGQSFSEQQRLRAEFDQMRQQDASRQQAEAMKVTRWGIDAFADEKGKDGQPLRPDFDLVLPQVIELYRANPDRDLNEAYETARWMRADTRQKLVQSERHSAEQKIGDRRALQAVRGNVRGLTSPVSKPAATNANGKPKSLRDILEETADDLGIN